jgi:hypothetical protein
MTNFVMTIYIACVLTTLEIGNTRLSNFKPTKCPSTIQINVIHIYHILDLVTLSCMSIRSTVDLNYGDVICDEKQIQV